jgi:hypothetical protein
MKRSEINKIVLDTIDFFHTMQFKLPKWACWAPSDWEGKCEQVSEIIECGLGWDITDFGSEDFEKVGLINFNLRNGIVKHSQKTYCEKIIVVGESQVTPLHTHYLKFEDIINRGGGNLIIELCQADENFNPTDQDVTVKIDGVPVTVSAGGKVTLTPGESIFLVPGVLHMFYGEPGKGRVLVGEVSTVNDDSIDNHFIGGSPRFPTIIEDEEPAYLLVNDYKKYV